ncbi:MAG: extracellular solute-binding protein [Caldilineaceae bacterium]|nr:extracellular solute-binding protein [Caldilineaceae bacterium]
MQSQLSRRRFLILSAAAMGTGALAACAAPGAAPATGGSDAPDAAAQTVIYWDWWGPTGSEVNQALFDRLPVALQESKPDLTLDYQNVPFGEYFRKFLAAHAAGDVPDVMHSSVYWARDFFDRDALLDLTPFIEVTPDLDPDQFIEGSLLQAVKGPAQYGVPGEGPDSNQIFINIDHFEEAGVTTDPAELAQWDWNDFTEAAKALTKKDGDEITQSGFLVSTPTAQTLSVWASCHGVGFYSKNADGLETGIGFNEKNAAVNGLNWFLDMLNVSQVSQAITPERQDWNQFMQGAASMVPAGPWQYGRLNSDAPDMNWSAMIWPSAPVEGGQQGTAVWNNMLVMPSKAKSQDAGWQFMEFWCALPWMVERLAIGSWMAPRKDFYETAEYKAELEKLPILSLVPKASAAGTPLVYIQQSALDAEIQPVLEAVMLQQQTPEEAIDALVAKGNEILVNAGYEG